MIRCTMRIRFWSGKRISGGGWPDWKNAAAEPIDCRAGTVPLDYYVDVPQYTGNNLKLRLKNFVATSTLIICRK